MKKHIQFVVLPDKNKIKNHFKEISSVIKKVLKL